MKNSTQITFAFQDPPDSGENPGVGVRIKSLKKAAAEVSKDGQENTRSEEPVTVVAGEAAGEEPVGGKESVAFRPGNRNSEDSNSSGIFATEKSGSISPSDLALPGDEVLEEVMDETVFFESNPEDTAAENAGIIVNFDTPANTTGGDTNTNIEARSATGNLGDPDTNGSPDNLTGNSSAENIDTVTDDHTTQAVAGEAESAGKISKSTRGRKSLKTIDEGAEFINIPPDEILFQKQYYAIGEVAEMFHVNQSLLRFWETEFDIIQPRKNRKGDRHFRPVDIKNLLLIHDLLRRRKLTIEGAKDFLKKNKRSPERFAMIQSLQKIKGFLLEIKATL